MAENWVQIGVNAQQLAELEKILGGGKRDSLARRAAQAAISRTITTGRAWISRRVAEEVKLRIGDIKAQLDVKRSSYDKLEGSIVFRKKATWLSQYLTSSRLRTGWKRGGVRVSVRRRSQPEYPTNETLPHAFVSSGADSRPVGIFERIGLKSVMRSGRYKGKLREVIRRKPGPSALGVFVHAHGQGAETVLAETLKELNAVFDKNLRSQINRFLNRESAATT